MTNLYKPPEYVGSTTQFFIIWTGSSYRIHSGCPNRNGNADQKYYQINQWGHVENIGFTNAGTTTYYAVSDGCPVTAYQERFYGTLSNNLFDAPGWSPYEPFYLAFILAFAIWLLRYCFGFLLGKGARI